MDLSKVSMDALKREMHRRDECEKMPKKNLIVLGPPGAGKGTQSNKILNNFCYCQLSTGDLLRDHVKRKTTLGLKAKEAMDKGQLVSDELVNSILTEAIESPQCSRGIIFDGYPRNKEQAKNLDSLLAKENRSLNNVIQLTIDENSLIERIEGRRVHPASGRVYHIKFNPPKEQGTDDVTGEPLIHRDDDRKEVVKSRIDVYNQKTSPVVDYYKSKGLLTKINATQPIDKIYTEIKNTLI